MECCKLQLGCLFVLTYVAVIYLNESKKNAKALQNTFFEVLVFVGMSGVILDGVLVYAVNYGENLRNMYKLMLSVLFFLSFDTVMFLFFIYMLKITDSMPKRLFAKVFLALIYLAAVVAIMVLAPGLTFVKGEKTPYINGLSAVCCFGAAAVYSLLAIGVYLQKRYYIEAGKRRIIFIYLSVLVVISAIQLFFQESQVSSLAVTAFVLGIYLSWEDPSVRKLSAYHHETVMSFANLVENRDSSTGGHIKRTSAYVELIVDALKENKDYRKILTQDYITNLIKAAPMHDIGKIAVPDAILQKPGRLTNAEYNIMKLHAKRGGEIIKEIFQNMGDEGFRKMAYNVARFHHEKWNGKGYPDGLRGEQIPLCARVMAVADVFDAVSENRCYRPAMPLEECFSIIEKGRGTDFDPLVVDVFLSIRDKVEGVHRQFEGAQ